MKWITRGAGVVVVAVLAAWGVRYFAFSRPAARTESPARAPAATSPPDASAGSPLTYKALVIGISDYASYGAEGWDDLGTASKDARAVANVLEKEYGFAVRTLLDQQATREAIMAAFDALTDDKESDAVLVYYAGHGVYEEKLGEGYWIPYNGRRKRDGISGRDTWIWNSTIGKIVNASPARHVLIVADACYGGSLFRGGEVASRNRQFQWYRRAISAPSRYLITSGDLEPVLDSGGAQHSVFCQAVLNYLSYPDKDVFSASDLGEAIREKVSMMTGQLVRMGQLPLPAHGGGEFVFAHGTALPAIPVDRESQTATETSPAVAAPAKRDWSAAVQSAVLLARQGATGAAQRIVSEAGKETADTRLLDIVKAYVDGERRQKSAAHLQQLIERLEARGTATNGMESGYARPRVLACLGPETRQADDESESLALLYRIVLRSELEAAGGISVVEREALDQTMQELDLGASGVADKRAQLEIGKLLPACLILLGDVFKEDSGEQVYVRLVDTETTRVVGSYTAAVKAGESKSEACRELARQVAAQAARVRPLEARVLDAKDGQFVAGVGSFQGAVAGQTFEVVSRRPVAGANDIREKVLGHAAIVSLGEMTSDLRWNGEQPPSDAGAPSDWWIRESMDRTAGD